MIDTDKYDNEGIELSDGGTICFPEDDGRIHRIDKDGNTIQTLHPEDTEWQGWYELFDTLRDLIAEVKRLREENGTLAEAVKVDNEILKKHIETLAEVERLREELNKQMEYIEWLEQFAPKTGEYNTSWEAYELAKGSEEE